MTCHTPRQIIRLKKRLPSREDIRKIDGNSFYTLLTGDSNALKEAYSLLPELTAEIINEEFGTELNSELVTSSAAFDFNFEKPYGK
ncbi:Eco47II family restriction endonuclease [Vibrio parahaemolyticus]|nr:Eco47II family restriction endonuclease [Vibrio parahaemolyticus]